MKWFKKKKYSIDLKRTNLEKNNLIETSISKKPIFSYRLLDDKKNNTGTNLEKSINPSKYKIQTEE